MRVCVSAHVGSMSGIFSGFKILKEKKKAIESSTCRGSFIAQVYNSSDTSFCKLNLPQISLS